MCSRNKKIVKVNPGDANVIISIKKGDFSVEKDTDNFESRNETTIEMIKTVELPDGKYYIHTGDLPKDGCFSYSGPLAIPCYIFLRWRQAKLPDFYDFYAFTPKPFNNRLDRLLWIGNGTHDFEPRMNVYEKYSKYKDFDILRSQDTYRDIYQHTDYKYLLDIEGRGYSGRLKYLMLTGSVVFIMDRPNVEYWHKEFEPWVHYVPVKRDASDLVEKFEKIQSMPDKGESIGIKCRARALEVFQKSHVYDYLKTIMSSTEQISV